MLTPQDMQGWPMRRHRNLGILLVLLAIPVLVITAAAGEPSRVNVIAKPQTDGTTLVAVTVTDAGGAPVPDVAVTMRAKTTFGWLVLADRTTDQVGRVQIILPASSRYGEIAIEAGDEGSLRAAIRLNPPATREPAVRPGRDIISRLSPQPGFLSPYPHPLQVGLLGLILGGIWTTYAYLVLLLVRIRRER